MSEIGHNSGDAAFDATSSELKQFVEQLEGCEEEIKDVRERMKEIRAEAKSRGYDTKVMNLVIKRRKRDKDDLAEEEAILEMYESALLV